MLHVVQLVCRKTTVIVDDTLKSSTRNYGNAVTVPTFHVGAAWDPERNESQDETLVQLMSLLRDEVMQAEDVRAVTKEFT